MLLIFGHRNKPGNTRQQQHQQRQREKITFYLWREFRGRLLPSFFQLFLKGFFPALALGAAEIRFEIPKFKFKCTSAPNRIASNRTDCDVKWPGSHGI